MARVKTQNEAHNTHPEGKAPIAFHVLLQLFVWGQSARAGPRCPRSPTATFRGTDGCAGARRCAGLAGKKEPRGEKVRLGLFRADPII